MLEERLRAWAAGRGYGLAIADIGVIATVRTKLEARRDSGLIDPAFFAERLSKFRFLEGVEMAGPKRVVMVAVPSPASVVLVRTGGRTIEALIPPTYVHYLGTFQKVLDDMMANALGAAVAETLKAPLKSLAAHMGLVRYGRNNITYAPGLGSGLQLCGYVVASEEWPAEAAPPREGREDVLDRCSSCTACVKICPTGAIREDRFLLHAERCFVLPSESARPLPAWARRPTRSICLIGCMDCQLVCPENKGRLKTVPCGIELTHEETEALLEAGRRLGAEGSGRDRSRETAEGPALASARAKIEGLGMTEDFAVMGRNLGYFLSR
ncbi:MAG TPA: 4Fe-4S double cluster binding domain-containing protein [Acidobacteriota bacterium]|nr:4Fe-4S double cluster binding domain-containing protein [Acidobacteriota bacterium]